MSYTPNFGLVYLDGTNHIYLTSTLDEDNWTFVDYQLYGYSLMLGGGVSSGWEVTDGGGLTVDISAGSGLVGGFYGVTTDEFVGLSLTASTDNFIYAQKNDDTALYGSVTFIAELSEGLLADAILLAKVTTDTDGVTTIDTTDREGLGWTLDLQRYLETHVHDGDPIPLIDLSAHVTGILDSSHFPSDIPTSKIDGILSEDNIPVQSHTVLSDIGRYTHDQIDDFIDTIADDRYKEFGDVLGVIQLQHLLSEAHIYYQPEDAAGFFRFIPNLVIIIPGISAVAASSDTPNYASLLDYVLTTANIDETNRLFYTGLGVALSPAEEYTRNWTTDDDWNSAVSTEGVYVATGSVSLAVLSSTTTYESEGTIVFHYDSGRISEFTTVEWTLVANGLNNAIEVRTATAATEDDLANAEWSDVLTDSGDAITSEDNRWIAVEVTLKTTDTSLTPELQDLTINYNAVGSGCGRMLWPVFSDFENGTLTDVSVTNDLVKLSLGGVGTYYSSGEAVSGIIDAGGDWTSWYSIEWNEDLPTSTDIQVYYRLGNTIGHVSGNEWVGPYTNPSGISLETADPTGRLMQLKVVFSTTSTDVTSILEDITVKWKE